MAKIKKLEMVKKVVTKRQFVYTKNGVNLDFTLSVDNVEDQLLPFKECLLDALNDVTETINDISE